MRWKLLAGFCTCCMSVLAMAGPFDDTLRKLEPEERSHQACIIRGLTPSGATRVCATRIG
jgi:hypothetical protein